MRNINLFFVLAAFLFLIPFAYAETVEDSIQEQIRINSNKMAVINSGDSLTLSDYLAADPEFKSFFRKFVLLIAILSILMVVDVILKGFAMWRASKLNSKGWFWALAIVNSLGIFPLIYLLVTNKSHKIINKKKKK